MKPLEAIGRLALGSLDYLGGVSVMAGSSFFRMFRRPFGMRDIVYQMEQVGIRSLPIAVAMATFLGMVIAFQFGVGLARFGAKEYVGPLTAVALARELAPVMTALIVGGRIGAGMAAEVGSMAVTEQIDAIRALGADPIKKLVVPRVMATMIVLPLLTIAADVLGFVGALFIGLFEFDLTPSFFYRSVIEVVRIQDVTSGVGKTIFFGYFIALIGCYQGFTTSEGTEGVGRATTRTVVMVSMLILISDFFLTKLFLAF